MMDRPVIWTSTEVPVLKAKRTRRPIAALGATALLLVALTGCNRSQSPSSAPSTGPSPTASAATDATFGASDSPLPGDLTPTASDPGSSSPAGVSATPAVPPTPDAVASELDQIQQLINDINDSLSGSDAGGE